MVSKQKPTGRASSIPWCLAAGLLLSGLLTLTGAALCARLISREVLQEESMGYCAAAILIVSGGAGEWLACRKAQHRRMVVSMLSAFCYLALLLCCTALFFGGQYDGIGVTALIIFGTGCAVGLLGLKKKHRGTGKMYKRAFAAK